MNKGFQKNTDLYFLFGLCVVVLLNLIQAGLTNLTGDEALYWMHSRHLDFGYRDHPPAIGLLIGLGYKLTQSELGVRLLVVFSNACTFWILYRLTKPAYGAAFWILVWSMPVLQLYGFIATPDAPLLLSTALYLLVWQRFVSTQSPANTIILGICMALLMWSKYHGIIIILFTMLPLKFLWFNKNYWLAAALGIVLFSPHLIWQVVNDLPTIKFHLNERNSDAFELQHILGYTIGQLGVFNPLVLGLCIWYIIRAKSQDNFELSLRWLFSCTLFLFFFNSFRGRVEPHWTAPLTLAATFILIRQWNAKGPTRLQLIGLSTFLAVILIARIFMVVDVLPAFHKAFHRDKNKMVALSKVASGLPVCFMNSYQNPSLYMFYTGQKAHAINNIEGGKNQFDYWNYNEAIHQRPMLLVANYDHPAFEEKTEGDFRFRVREYKTLPVLHKLKLRTDEWLHHAKSGDTLVAPAWLINGNSYPLNLSDSAHTIRWEAYMNHKKKNEARMAASIDGLSERIEAGDSLRVVIRVVMPDRPGKNLMCLASQVDDLPFTYQSNWLRIMVKE